jgi:hypothetical protein
MTIAFQDRPVFCFPTPGVWLAGDERRRPELVDVGGGFFIVVIPATASIRRDDGPSQDGDTLSLQPDGTYRARPKGTAAAWERCRRHPSANLLLFTSNGVPYPVVYRAA